MGLFYTAPEPTRGRHSRPTTMAVSGCAVMTDACHQRCFTPANHYFLSLPPPPAERRRRRVNILIAPKHAIALRSTRRLVNGLALRPLRAPGASLRSALPSLNGRELLIHRARRVIMSIRVDALTSRWFTKSSPLSWTVGAAARTIMNCP